MLVLNAFQIVGPTFSYDFPQVFADFMIRWFEIDTLRVQ